MTKFFCPKAAVVKLANGQSFSLHRGIMDLPDAVSNTLEAHRYGIKPTSEMTDAEWWALGYSEEERKVFLPVPATPTMGGGGGVSPSAGEVQAIVVGSPSAPEPHQEDAH